MAVEAALGTLWAAGWPLARVVFWARGPAGGGGLPDALPLFSREQVFPIQRLFCLFDFEESGG
jgi:hypothetical protein